MAIPLRVVVIAVLAGVLAACSTAGGDAENQQAGPGTTATTTEFLGNFVEFTLADAEGSIYSREQLGCLAREIYASVGEDRLVAIGFAPDGRAGVQIFQDDAGFTPAERTSVAGAFDTCVPDAYRTFLSSAGEPDPVFADCYLRELLARDISLELALFAEVPEIAAIVGPAYEAAQAVCEPADE